MEWNIFQHSDQSPSILSFLCIPHPCLESPILSQERENPSSLVNYKYKNKNNYREQQTKDPHYICEEKKKKNPRTDRQKM